MPLPGRLARFNRVVTNRLARPLAGRLPGLALVEHTGRRSGRAYRTPVAAFRRGGTLVIALTYGPGADWVRNVLAAGGCGARVRGAALDLTAPRVVHDERRRAVAPPVRMALRALGAADFLELTIVDVKEG